MTSAVSRDEIEGELWRLAGRVDPWTIERVMRLIDKYSITTARKYSSLWGGVDLPSVKMDDNYEDILPGAQDLIRNMARCYECLNVKKIPYNFNLDRTRKPGYQRICRACAHAKKPRKTPDPNLILTCNKCGDTKPAEGNYYKRDKNVSGYDATCKDCVDFRRTCIACGERKHQNEFDDAPHNRPVCQGCRDKGAEVYLRLFYCRKCSMDKWVECFPPEKLQSPIASYACLECNGKEQEESEEAA